jgi:hypothetical protein
MIGILGFDSWQGLVIFLFTTVSRTVLGPTQPPIQWIPGALSLGVKWLWCEADHSPPSSAKVNAPSWHGAQLKKAQGQLYFYLHLTKVLEAEQVKLICIIFDTHKALRYWLLTCSIKLLWCEIICSML